MLVRWTVDATGFAQQSALGAVFGTSVRSYAGLVPRLELVRIDVSRIKIEKAAEFLAANQSTEYGELDYYVRAFDTPNDLYFPKQWNMQNTGLVVAGHAGVVGADMRAEPGWDSFTGDPRFVIAVIDTGVQAIHPDLRQNIWVNPGETPGNGADDDGNGLPDDIQGWDFYSGDADPDDPEGHGTHVAGIIGAVGDNSVGVAGINWRCRLMPLRFIGSGHGLTSDAIASLEYAVKMNVRVSCNAWGDDDRSKSLEDAIAGAGAQGHIFVTAAGNRHTNIDDTPVYPASFKLPNMITVASLDHFDELGAKSNWGLETVHIGAPGVYVLSTSNDNEYQVLSGTSMAAAHVAGVVAMVMAFDPTLSSDQARAQVFENARLIPALNGMTVTGGVVDLEGAL